MLFEVFAHFPPDAAPQRLRPVEAETLAEAHSIARNLHGLWPVGTVTVGGELLSLGEEMPPASAPVQESVQRRPRGFAVSAEAQAKAQATLARQRAEYAKYEAKASDLSKRKLRAHRKKAHEARLKAYWAAKFPHLAPNAK